MHHFGLGGLLVNIAYSNSMLNNTMLAAYWSMVYIVYILDILSYVLLIFPFTLSIVKTSAVDISEVTGKDQMDAQPTKKGRGRKQ